jgi:hypothetical protein
VVRGQEEAGDGPEPSAEEDGQQGPGRKAEQRHDRLVEEIVFLHPESLVLGREVIVRVRLVLAFVVHRRGLLRP